MLRDYKIYYNDSYVLISCDEAQRNKKFDKVISDPHEVHNFLARPDQLFDSSTNETILLFHPKPGEEMCKFMEMTDLIIAGGGIVFNENGEVLLIHRRGKWDLPKGKIEIHECIADGARREVVEETGVKIDTIRRPPITTYHAYKLKGKNCLKQTEWYLMKAKPGQTNLVPQTEEDIEKVEWVKPENLQTYKDGAYPLIRDLLHDNVRWNV